MADLESLGSGFQLIMAGYQIGEEVASHFVADAGVASVSFGVQDSHPRGWNNRAGRVGNRSAYRAASSLRIEWGAGQESCKRRNKESEHEHHCIRTATPTACRINSLAGL